MNHINCIQNLLVFLIPQRLRLIGVVNPLGQAFYGKLELSPLEYCVLHSAM